MCFPVSFAKFLRTPFLQKTLGRLLLSLEILIHPLTYARENIMMVSFHREICPLFL